MRPSVLWALMASFVLLQGAGAGPEPDPAAALSCRVVGIQTLGDTGAAGREWVWLGMPFGETVGTTLLLAVTSSDPEAVPLMAVVSELRSFHDSTGADLAAVGLDDLGAHLWTRGVELKRQAAPGVRLADIRGKRVPSAGSRTIAAEGTVTSFVGLKPAQARQDGVSLQKGTRITAGPVPFEIVEVTFPQTEEAPEETDESTEDAIATTSLGNVMEDVDWALGLDEPSILVEDDFPQGMFWHGDAAMTITLEARPGMEKIAAIELLGPAGKPVEWANLRTTIMISDPAGQSTLVGMQTMIGLPEKLEKVDVVVHYYEEIRQVKVPFSVECGLAVESIAGP